MIISHDPAGYGWLPHDLQNVVAHAPGHADRTSGLEDAFSAAGGARWGALVIYVNGTITERNGIGEG